MNRIILNEIRIGSEEPISPEINEKINGIRLFEYLQKYSKKIASDCGFQEVFGKIEEFDNNNIYNNITQPTRHLKILISTTLWEAEECLIVIMSEDYQGEKVNLLSNQAIYKDQLLATVSHDLRTPLNGIIGILEMTLELITEKTIKKSLTIALRSSQLLLFMINDILDFSLITDPNRLKQVILNLLSNALKYTQQGLIKVCLEPLDTPFSVKIYVEDSGTGIKKEDIPKLFKFFGKIEGGDNEKFNANGIGLGLAISQSLIKKLNNDNGEEIQVHSEFGKGSVFYFNLRDFNFKKNEKNPMFNTINLKKKSFSLEPEDFDEKSLRVNMNQMEFNLFQDLDTKFNEQDQLFTEKTGCKKDENMDFNKLRTKNILVVDDDQINIMVYSLFLNTFPDCNYELAFNGQHALEMILQRASDNFFYDIIFMDCNMPLMDGYTATRQIIQLEKQNIIPHVPIVASTANSNQAEQERCIQCGMIDFLLKPYGKKQLRDKIDKYC